MAGTIIAKLLLLSLKLAKPFKTEAKTLAQQLTSVTNQAMPALLPKVLSLLSRALNHSPIEKSSGFGFKLFAKNKPSPQQNLRTVIK